MVVCRVLSAEIEESCCELKTISASEGNGFGPPSFSEKRDKQSVPEGKSHFGQKPSPDIPLTFTCAQAHGPGNHGPKNIYVNSVLENVSDTYTHKHYQTQLDKE